MGKLVFLFHLIFVATTIADWRQTGNFYQVYPRSFKDSNGDGIGDLNGVAEKIQYLKDLGMDGVWLSPIMKSPMADFGYDISDYYAIHDEYGTMDDFDNLLKKCDEIGIKLILDFVPNHTSDESEWFIKSVQGDPEYKDFYIWHPGKLLSNGTRVPPNNWVSVFRFPAWKWNEDRQEYYLHQFADKQPDLNYRNPKVVEAMKDVIRFWLNKGVGGFRIDAVPFLFEIPADADGNYMDEPQSGECDDPDSYCFLKHIYTQDQPETFDMAYQWREVVDEYEDRVLLIEAYTSLPNIMKFFGDGKSRDGAHIPFNFELLSYTNKDSTAKDIYDNIERWIYALPAGRSSNWVLGNHDQPRIATRLGEGRADLYNILLQTLPGNAVTYNGEEIRMTNVYISWNDTVDPAGCNTNSSVYEQYSRDPARTPMQWDDSKNAGFSDGPSTWLPVADNYKTVNVKVQDAAASSHLKLFRELVKLKKSDVFQKGDYKALLLNKDVLAYSRTYNGVTRVVVLNFGKEEHTVDLTSDFCKFSSSSTVLASSLSANTKEGSKLDTAKLRLPAESGFVLSSASAKQVLSILVTLATAAVIRMA